MYLNRFIVRNFICSVFRLLFLNWPKLLQQKEVMDYFTPVRLHRLLVLYVFPYLLVEYDTMSLQFLVSKFSSKFDNTFRKKRQVVQTRGKSKINHDCQDNGLLHSHGRLTAAITALDLFSAPSAEKAVVQTNDWRFK